MSRVLIALFILISGAYPAMESTAWEEVGHIVIIGIDGLGPEGIQNADTPVMDELMKTGAYSMTAQAVLPTTSSPNWASMLMGASPKEHGITSNAWEPEQIKKKSYCNGVPGQLWPTIFKVIQEELPEANTACFHQWGGFGRLVGPDAPTLLQHTPGAEETIHTAIGYIQSQKPIFTFIQLDNVDHAGHHYGYGTNKYHEATSDADTYIGQVIKGLKKANIYQETVLIISSDHGGSGKGHGGNTPEERNIPWIIHGPNIIPGKQVQTPINTYDTAPTALYLLGIHPPDCWTGNAVKAAFEDQ